MATADGKMPRIIGWLKGKGHEDFAARQVETNSDRIILWRATWTETGHGRGLSTIVDRKVGGWYVWADGQYLGDSSTQAAALALAAVAIAVQDED